MKKNHNKLNVLISLVLGAVVTTTGFLISQDANAYNKTGEEIKQLNGIDSVETNKNSKLYADIENVKLNAGFDFKVPDYVIDGNRPFGYHIRKISDSSNAVQIAFNNDERNNNKFSIFMFKGESGESLKKINESRNNTDNNQDIQVNEQNMNINNIKGRCIELIISDIESNNSDGNLLDSECVKYFVWEDEGVSYAIEYSKALDLNNKITVTSLSKEEIGKIANSLKKLGDIKNVDYAIDINANK